MAYRYEFVVQDVTCEHCEARIHDALHALPGTQQVELVRTPQDQAQVVFTTGDAVDRPTIEQAIERKSEGTTHHYVVMC